jgi:phosphoenolpyruvate carboxykinase (ATP)
MEKHGTDVYLINTGWSGGPFGEGKRMDINLTREMVQAALSGALKDVEYKKDPFFHTQVPVQCPNIPDQSVLFPVNTWSDKPAFEQRAQKLAEQFSAHFDKAYGSKNIDQAVKDQCPGK